MGLHSSFIRNSLQRILEGKNKMAIQHNISKDNSEYGVKFDNAYYRIVSTSINRQLGTDPKFKVTIDLAAYATSS